MQSTTLPKTVLPPDWITTLTQIERQIEACLTWAREREAAPPAERCAHSLAQIDERVRAVGERIEALAERAKERNAPSADLDAQLERGEESIRNWLAALSTVQRASASLCPWAAKPSA